MVILLDIKTDNECNKVVRNLQNKKHPESIRNILWLTSVNRLPVQVIVSLSCFVTTKECPMVDGNEEKTQQHLPMGCCRAKESSIYQCKCLL